MPVDENNSQLGTELATIDGVTYVSLPDGVTLPTPQPVEIAASVQLITPDDALKTAIKAASSHFQLINARVVEQIRSRYTVDEEIKALRLAGSADAIAWSNWADTCRAWGKAEGLKLMAETTAEIAKAVVEVQNKADALTARTHTKLVALKNMTPNQVETWCGANITNLAQAKDALTTLAVAVSILARRL
jgi:hypothetical protein